MGEPSKPALGRAGNSPHPLSEGSERRKEESAETCMPASGGREGPGKARRANVGLHFTAGETGTGGILATN